MGLGLLFTVTLRVIGNRAGSVYGYVRRDFFN